VESPCERGNEPSGSIKCWETTEWLHNLWPLKWYSAPQIELVSGGYSSTPKWIICSCYIFSCFAVK
jgi:hypothetical protein